MSKLTTDDIRLGATMEATFYPNSVKESGFRHKATHLDGRHAPKVVLCDDPRLGNRHPELGKKIIKLVVEIADQLRKTAELGSGLSVRATDEACIYLKHPLIATERNSMLPEILTSSFCGRYNGRWSDVSS